MWVNRVKRFLIRWALVAAFVLAGGRLALFMGQVGKDSLQMDFSAFYTAGQALNAGLTPYENHVATYPAIWDGIATGRFSRFYYPPLAASFFQPWAWWPYATAKHLWLFFSLLCLLSALFLSLCVLKARLAGNQILVVGVVTALFFPLLPFFERGQVDALTLVLLMGALFLMVGDAPRPVLAGICIALAMLFKFQCVLLLPFLIVWRRWRVLAGFAGGGLALLLLSLLLNGPAEVREYALVHMPRIAAFGAGREPDPPLGGAIYAEALAGVPAGYTVKDGQIYRRTTLFFIENAGLPRLLQIVLAQNGRLVGLDLLSTIVFILLFGLWLGPAWWNRRSVQPANPGPTLALHRPGLLDWQLILVIILLGAPLTWAMNMVWLLPLVPVLATRPAPFPGYILCLAGFLLAALPESWLPDLQLPAAKNVLAEGMILAGLWGMNRND